MISKFRKHFHLTFILCVSLLVINCENREPADPPLPPGSPVGEYQVSLIIIRWVDNNGTQQTDLATTDCDQLSIIDFNSNNTLEITNYNVGNDANCSNTESILGSWESDGPLSNTFVGTFSLNSTFNGLSIYNGFYNKTADNVEAIELRFTTDINGVSYNYEIDAIGI